MLVLVLNSGSAAYILLCLNNKCSKQVSKSQMLCLWFHIHLQLFFFSIYFYKTMYLMNIIILHCNYIIVLLYYFIIVLLCYCIVFSILDKDWRIFKQPLSWQRVSFKSISFQDPAKGICLDCVSDVIGYTDNNHICDIS